MLQLPGYSPRPEQGSSTARSAIKLSAVRTSQPRRGSPCYLPPCTLGLSCPCKADWGQVQGLAAHLTRSRRQRRVKSTLPGSLVGSRGWKGPARAWAGLGPGAAPIGAWAARRGGGGTAAPASAGFARAVPAGKPLTGPPPGRLPPLPWLLSAGPAGRALGRERWPTCRAPDRAPGRGLWSSSALLSLLRSPRSPGAAPPPGALLRPSPVVPSCGVPSPASGQWLPQELALRPGSFRLGSPTGQ